MMSIATFGDHVLPNASSWTVEDVCRFFSSLELTQDYSSRIKDLSVSGQVLLSFNSTSLLDAIAVADSNDRSTLIRGINKHLTPTTSSTPSSASTTSPSSLSSNVSSPKSGSQLSPEAFKFLGKNGFLTSPEEQNSNAAPKDSDNRKYLKSYKSRSVDQLLNDSTGSGVDCHAPLDTPHSSHLFKILRAENLSLKRELESYYERVSRLQKLELELQQLQDAYRLLEGTSSRKARLEKAMRERLEGELLRMKQTQAQQKAQLHSIKRNSSLHLPRSDGVAKKDRDVMVEKLLQQNQESISLRQKIETDLQFAKATLEEKETVTDSVRKDDEPQERKQSLPGISLDNRQEETDIAKTYLSNLEGLQSLLTAMQASSENRQRLEQQLRKQLEDKIKELEEGIGDHKEKRGDQELRIATLEADLAQMEQRCTELLAERQLATNAIRDTHSWDKEEELRTMKSHLEICLAQLEEAQQRSFTQEKRLISLETTLKEKQSLVEKLQSCLYSGHLSQEEQPFCNGGHVQHIPLQNFTQVGPTQSHSTISRAIRKTSSPLPVYNEASHGYCTTVNSTPLITQVPPPPLSTTINPPTLPSYDEHLQGTRYSHLISHSPVTVHHGSMGSHSFPNTPETVRRKTLCEPPSDGSYRFCTNPSIRTTNGLSLAPQGRGGIYKSLTPPPLHYPKQRPPLVTSHSVSHSHVSHCNGTLSVPRQDYYYDNDSVDSLDLILNSSSSPPYSLSPPSHHPMGSAYHTSPGYTHKHSNSLPTSHK